jgi:PAS domain S-box-containing protein
MQTLEAIIRSAGDAIITADAAGDIVTWNPTAERMFGWGGEAEVVDKPLTLIIPERFHPRNRDPG